MGNTCRLHFFRYVQFCAGSILLLVCCLSSASAQGRYQKVLPVRGTVHETSVTSDGGSLVAGGDSICAVIMRLDAAGNTIWRKILCPSIAGYLYRAFYLRESSDGSIWCAGTIFPAYGGKTFVWHLDELGNPIWSGLISEENGLTIEQHSSGSEIWVAADGNFWAASLFRNSAVGQVGVNISKIDPNTHIIRNIRYFVPLLPDHFELNSFITQNHSGDILVTTNERSPSRSVAYVLCITQDMALKWAKKYPDFYISHLESTHTDDSIYGGNYYKYLYRLFKFNPDGTFDWIKEVHSSESGYPFSGRLRWNPHTQKIWLYGHLTWPDSYILDKGVLIAQVDRFGNSLKAITLEDCLYLRTSQGHITPENGFQLSRTLDNEVVLARFDENMNLEDTCPAINFSLLSLTDVDAPQEKDTIINFYHITTEAPAIQENWVDVLAPTQSYCKPSPFGTATFEIPDRICPFDSLELKVLSSVYVHYSWIVPGGTLNKDANYRYWLTYSQFGDYYISLAQNQLLCNDTITKLIHVASDVSYTSQHIDTLLCPGQTLSIDVSAPDALGYIWNDGATDPARVWGSSGQWSVEIVGNECNALDTFNVRYFDPPVFWAAADTTICIDTDIPAPAVPQVAVWEWNGIPASPPFSADLAGIYSLYALFNHGCTASDTVHIALVDCDTLPRLYVPNIFTPASGDANSVFSVFFNPQVTHLWTHIYDRWGTMVYRAEGAEQPRWDGTMNGKLMPPGVYAVVTALRPAGEAVQVLHRTVTLVR